MIKLAKKNHLNLVKQERARQCCKTSSNNLKASFPTVPPPLSCSLPANSTDTAMHYSFDMAQQVTIKKKDSKYSFQVHYSCDAFQPGPIYFLSPRKCAIFGMCCKAILRQVLLSSLAISPSFISPMNVSVSNGY